MFTTEPTYGRPRSKWRRVAICVFVFGCRGDWSIGLSAKERERGGSRGADLGDGRVEDVADVARCRLVPLPQGQRVGVQPPLDGLGLGPGQSGQQHGFVYILAVLADEVGQPGVLQPLLLLLAL